MKNHVAEIDVVTTFSKLKIFCNKPGMLLSSLCVHLTQCVKLILNILRQTLFRMKLVTNVVFLVLSSENND